MRTEHPIYDTVEKWIEADQEQNRTVIKMLDRRGRCERCGCDIDGIGLCAGCSDILDREADG